MRILRVTALILAVASILFCGWATHTYNQKQNHDVPVLTTEVDLLEISVKDKDAALLSGLSAYDKTDGDLTKQIMVASTSHFIEPGVVNVKYVVFDSHNNSATLTRKVKYTDYQSPRFSISKAPVYVKGKAFDLMDYIEVEDDLDGEISDRIRTLSSAVSNYMTGDFPLTLQVTNSCGDSERIELMVTYLENEPNVEIQLKEYILYLEEGATFDPEAQIKYAAAGGEAIPFEYIAVEGTLDVNTPAFYHLTYKYTDGNNHGQTNLTVVVGKAGDAA